jgi:hypothetical protein
LECRCNQADIGIPRREEMWKINTIHKHIACINTPCWNIFFMNNHLGIYLKGENKCYI